MVLMNILLTGINHKTAPVEMRELLAIESGRLTDATRVLLNAPGVEEAMILCTCNRVEVLASHRANCPDLLRVLGDHLGVNTRVSTFMISMGSMLCSICSELDPASIPWC
jgi:glutamyl-tRNA reductase